jgi:hypothetical protein
LDVGVVSKISALKQKQIKPGRLSVQVSKAQTLASRSRWPSLDLTSSLFAQS